MKDDATLEAEDNATSSSSSSNHTKGLYSSFDSYTVHQLADYLKRLAVMGIDKCTSWCLILCPHLFERYFDETFPVLTDLRHFTPMPTSFTAIARTMRMEYEKQHWNAIAAKLEYELLSFCALPPLQAQRYLGDLCRCLC